MSNMRFSDISIKFIKLTFKSRFFMAKTCKKLPFISKVVNKLLFEGDDIQFLPRNSTINNLKSEKIEINRNMSVSKDFVLPSEVLKEMINQINLTISLWTSASAEYHRIAMLIPMIWDVYFLVRE